jgi:Centromere protein Scm3/Forkhead domain
MDRPAKRARNSGPVNHSPTAELDQELFAAKARNNSHLKSRFESIFDKYERDFTGVGDEIDVFTGEIVVNNGHIRRLLHETHVGPMRLMQAVTVGGKQLESRGGAGSDCEDESDEEDLLAAIDAIPKTTRIEPKPVDTSQISLAHSKEDIMKQFGILGDDVLKLLASKGAVKGVVTEDKWDVPANLPLHVRPDVLSTLSRASPTPSTDPKETLGAETSPPGTHGLSVWAMEESPPSRRARSPVFKSVTPRRSAKSSYDPSDELRIVLSYLQNSEISKLPDGAYCELARQAIEFSPKKSLPVNEIRDWIYENTAIQISPKALYSSVHKALNTNKAFLSHHEGKGRRTLWSVRPGSEVSFLSREVGRGLPLNGAVKNGLQCSNPKKRAVVVADTVNLTTTAPLASHDNKSAFRDTDSTRRTKFQTCRDQTNNSPLQRSGINGVIPQKQSLPPKVPLKEDTIFHCALTEKAYRIRKSLTRDVLSPRQSVTKTLAHTKETTFQEVKSASSPAIEPTHISIRRTVCLSSMKRRPSAPLLVGSSTLAQQKRNGKARKARNGKVTGPSSDTGKITNLEALEVGGEGAGNLAPLMPAFTQKCGVDDYKCFKEFCLKGCSNTHDL